MHAQTHGMTQTTRQQPRAAADAIRGSAKLALLLALAMAPWAAFAWLLHLVLR